EMIQRMMGDPKSGAVLVEAQPEQNALVVRGTNDQITEVQAIIKALNASGTGSGPAASNMRIHTMERGSATNLAEALQRMLSQMRNNPVEITIINRNGQPQQPATSPSNALPTPPQPRPMPMERIPEEQSSAAPGPGNIYFGNEKLSSGEVTYPVS